eukprot:evm.model.scf_71.5 EVM.evm.TU.scf_71.5   scf_71:73824-78422(-)
MVEAVKELKTRIRYHRLKLTPCFEKQLEKRKHHLEEKVIQLQCMADDCQNWQSADMVEARRGMEVSLLKYRLAKELGQESRHMLDDMLDSIRPYTMDPHGLEEAYWRYFDGKQEELEVLELEREEAETKLAGVGFSLRHLPSQDEVPENGISQLSGDEREARIMREVQRVHDETHALLKSLEAKKAQLAALRGNSNGRHRRLSSLDGGKLPEDLRYGMDGH